MSDCLLWLIILPFRRASQCIQRRGCFQTPTSWVVGCVCCLARVLSQHLISCTAAFSSPPPHSPPLLSDTCSYKVRLLRTDMLSAVLRAPLKKSMCHPWGALLPFLWMVDIVTLWKVWLLSPCLSPGGGCRSSGGPKSYSAGCKDFFLNYIGR